MNKNKGFTFIEVLIAFVILTTGILGAVALQVNAKKGSFDAMQRSSASAIAQFIIERMRSNSSDPVLLEAYQGVYGDSGQQIPAERCNAESSLCTPEQMRLNDLYEWEQMLQGNDVLFGGNAAGGLVDARGCLQHNDNAIEVIVSWQARTATVDSTDSSYSFEYNCGAKSDKRRQIYINTFIY